MLGKVWVGVRWQRQGRHRFLRLDHDGKLRMLGARKLTQSDGFLCQHETPPEDNQSWRSGSYWGWQKAQFGGVPHTATARVSHAGLFAEDSNNKDVPYPKVVLSCISVATTFGDLQSFPCDLIQISRDFALLDLVFFEHARRVRPSVRAACCIDYYARQSSKKKAYEYEALSIYLRDLIEYSAESVFVAWYCIPFPVNWSSPSNP